MVKPRLIPCLLLKHGMLVRSQGFSVHQVIGNPINTVMRLSNWNVDELILLDISSADRHDLRRDDLYVHNIGATAVEVLKAVSKVCCMPLAFGGRIRTLEDIRLRLSAGADKCVINTQAVENPGLIREAAKRFGSQCVVVSIDVRRRADGAPEVFTHGGQTATGIDPAAWAKEAQRAGAGEIFLNSVDRDGTAQGYDLDLIRAVVASTSIPVIACGGVGNESDFPRAIKEGGASAAAAANIFHFFELSYPGAKRECLSAGLPMREVRVDSRWFSREPSYPSGEAVARVQARQALADRPLSSETARPTPMRWCTKCLYPIMSAAPLELDAQGVCTGCSTAEAKEAITPGEWRRRRCLLEEKLSRVRSRDGKRHDCVIPVSGGKDSYYQTHFIKNELGLNPLLVTYNGNNYSEVGWRNLLRMKEVFGVDHIIYSPSVELLRKLNRLGFIVMGDMNWHAHVGITTLPVRIAAQMKIPALIWGEYGYLDLGGQFSMNDFPEMSYRDRREHFARGYEWNYFVGMEGITAQDMASFQYPSDQDLYDLDLRGLYLGNYAHWEANTHGKMVVERYGFEISEEPFERTYRRMSNLDDIHENGVHDYLKYIKFGYGRCTDHVCKDIRAGIMSREEGIERVRRMDHIKPSDLNRWLPYVGMTEAEFDRIADTFRDPRVWYRREGEWKKDNVWEQSAPSRRTGRAEPAGVGG